MQYFTHKRGAMRVLWPSHGVVTWDRVISLMDLQPLNAIVNSSSSCSISIAFFTPASPAAANAKTTGLPICHRQPKTPYFMTMLRVSYSVNVVSYDQAFKVCGGLAYTPLFIYLCYHPPKVKVSTYKNTGCSEC